MDAFTYDLNGDRMIQESHSGGSTTTRAFIYDREDMAVEYSDDTFCTVSRQYIHGPGIDEPLAIVGEGKLNYTYYLHDGLGSVTGIVDMDGKLQGIYDYSAFGETRRDTVTIENRYRYTSREHVEDGLYYYRARHMRPDLGRFTSMDSLGMVYCCDDFNRRCNWNCCCDCWYGCEHGGAIAGGIAVVYSVFGLSCTLSTLIIMCTMMNNHKDCNDCP